MVAKKPSTGALTWNFKRETFSFRYHVWNVDRAKQIVKDKPRPIFEVELEPFRRFLGIAVKIDWNKARSDQVNLNDPLLLAYGYRKRLPIDGWHRIAKALLKGLKTLSATKLTQEESKQVHRYTRRRVRRRR